jgi:Transposase DDE domain
MTAHGLFSKKIRNPESAVFLAKVIIARPRTHVTKADTVIYRSRQAVCSLCPMKSQCCPSTPVRKVVRSIHEAARNVARDLANTDRYRQSRKDRKKVEMLFAHLKRILHLTRLRLRGMSGARDEFLLAAIAPNLRRMAKSWHPPPDSLALART